MRASFLAAEPRGLQFDLLPILGAETPPTFDFVRSTNQMVASRAHDI